MKKSKLIQLVLFVILSITAFFLLRQVSLESIRQLVETNPIFGPIIYVVLWAFLPIGLFPAGVLALVGGVAFGLIQGVVLLVMGASLNMLFMFWISRYLARDYIKRYIYQRHEKLYAWLYTNERRLTQTLLVVRLFPIFSYELVNYTFGLTEIKTKNYLLVSMIGILPGSLAYVNIGDKALDISSPQFILSLVIFGVFIILTSIGVYFYRKKTM